MFLASQVWKAMLHPWEKRIMWKWLQKKLQPQAVLPKETPTGTALLCFSKTSWKLKTPFRNLMFNWTMILKSNFKHVSWLLFSFNECLSLDMFGLIILKHWHSQANPPKPGEVIPGSLTHNQHQTKGAQSFGLCRKRHVFSTRGKFKVIFNHSTSCKSLKLSKDHLTH